MVAELAIGSTFADHVIRGVVGRGGMGVVYRAVHLPLDREVALKLIAPDSSADPEFRDRFRREFRATAAIQHPNVIPVYNAGEEDGQLYVTMRFIDGTDLARLLGTEKRLSPERAAAIIAQVAAGLDAAHAAGIVHRDVKPANVLMEGDTAILTDFGLMKNVRAQTQITQVGSVIGTFDYAAPEQLREGPIDARTDVYGLGAVLFQAITGRVPYPRETAAATMLAHLDAPPPSVLSVLPDAPEALGDVVRRAMAKDPNARFQSAGDVGQAALAAVALAHALAPERSVATGAARPGGAHPRVPLPPALNREGPFVGRADLLAQLEAHYRKAAAGERQFVLLGGEPGIGKTSVARELAQRVHAEGATVLFGRSDPESLIPYQPFIGAVGHYLAHREPPELERELAELGRVLPGLRRSIHESIAEDPETRRYRLFEAVSRVLAFAASERPLLLILDDLHWADTSTTLLGGHLLQDAEPSRLMVLGTSRHTETTAALDELLGRLRRTPAFQRIALDGLTPEETGALVAARDDRDMTSQFIRRLRDETEGNPFFIEETLRSLAGEEGGVALERALSRIEVPEGVKELIARRLALLSDTTDRVLTIASVVGREFQLDLLEEVTGTTGDDTLEALEEAIGAGLVREIDGGRFAYSHALVREALYERQSASRRVRLHARIGEALEKRGTANPAALAYHFAEAHDERALPYALAAARAAEAALAYEEAAEHYRRVIAGLGAEAAEGRETLGGSAMPAYIDVLLDLGAAEARSGDPAARETFRRAAELARSPAGARPRRARVRRLGRRAGRGRQRGDRTARARARGGRRERRAAGAAGGLPALLGRGRARAGAQRAGARAGVRAARHGARDGEPPRRAAARRAPRRAAAAERGDAGAVGPQRRARAGGRRPALAHLRPARGGRHRGRARGAPAADRARARAAPAAVPVLRDRLGGGLGADGGALRRRRPALARHLRAGAARAGARRRDDPRRADAGPAPARGPAAGLHRARRVAGGGQPGARRLALGAPARLPRGRRHPVGGQRAPARAGQPASRATCSGSRPRRCCRRPPR